jgi:DNA-binding NarL/FixJ family response regulator
VQPPSIEEIRMAAPGVSIERSLVGRDEELARIEATLRGERGGVLLEGDPGIGKTALWIAGTELARDRGTCVLEARPGETERRLSFSALDDLLSNELDEVLPHLPPPQRRALEVALLRTDDPDAAPDPRGVSTAVLEVVRWIARDRPVVVAVDDLQWLDPGSARVLTFALRRLEPGGVAVLATRRTGREPTPSPLVRTLDERGIPRLTLRPLEIAAIETIIRRQLGVRLSRPARREVFELSGGNPLFAVELARAHGVEPPWSAGAELPDRLASAIRRRVGAFEPAVREVLCAAAITEEPSVRILASVTGRPDTEVLDAAVAAERGGVALIGDDPMAQGAQMVGFRHPLFRSAATELLPPARVRALHKAYARVVDDPEELARHLAASASVPDHDVAAALDRASSHARNRGALDAAAELYELAARFTMDGEEELRARRTVAAAASLFDAGDRCAAEEHLLSRLDAFPDGVQRANALIALAIMCWNDLARSDDFLDRAEDEADDVPRIRAKILAARAWIEAYGRSLERAAACAGEAVQLSDRHRIPVVRAALAVSAWARLLQGRDASEALARGLALGESYVRADPCTPRLSAAMGRRWVGDLITARELLEAEAETISATGAETSLLEVLGPLAEIQWRLGDWPAAARNLRAAEDLADDVGVTPSRAAQWSHVEALLAAGRGRLEEALGIARRGAAAAGTVGDRFSEAHNHAAIAFALLAAGDAPAAVDSFTRARTLLDELGVREVGVLGAMGDGLEALAAAEDRDELAAVVADLEVASADGRPWAAADAARGRAFLLEGEDAEKEIARAAKAYTELAMPLEVARCELWLGTWFRRRRQQRRARETLARAKEAFADLGAAPWEARAASELARIGGRPAAPTRLTEAEREIAVLVAEGFTNSDIAAQLHLSVRTVEAHLSHAYTKFGVRSRAALVAKVQPR